jgi:hypothetical protein
VNSEELELSLRTEFESYLKGVLADIRQDVTEFQKNFEAEFEKHKSQTDEAFRNLFKRFESGPQFEESFNESVLEHLRLARDEGATITANAFGEAEKLKEATAPAAEFDTLRDAINEISSKTSQSEILKALVEAASNFTPRGAFFIVKNEHFVGWRAFGEESGVNEAEVRGIQFPVSADTVLADAVTSLSTVRTAFGGHGEDELLLDPLEFGQPDRMFAIPLMARGRGVAVLYADYGNEGVALNVEALETLVRVAGLTVELAASGVQPAPVHPEPVEQVPAAEPEQVEETVAEVEETPVEEVSAPVDEVAETADDSDTGSFDMVTPEDVTDEAEVEVTVETVEEVAQSAAFEEPAVQYVEPEIERFREESPVAADPFAAPVEEEAYFEPVEEVEVVDAEFAEAEPEFEEAEPFESVSEPEVEHVVEEPVTEFEPPADPSYGNGSAGQAVAEPLTEVATAQAARTRYRDRNVDLPIEVADDERRLHNDARRFARLLVSEIKLYNEQKVTEGRESGDLYDRLREAIDRSRDMYDKRVQEPVAAKFDYFHYELVNSLAEGEDVKLGASYPGARVLA